MKKKFEYFETKTGKLLFFGIILSVPSLLVIFVICTVFTGPSGRQRVIESDSLETVHGVVDTLFNDVQNHDTRTAILTNKAIYQIEPSWASEIEIGDSLSKDKGSFLLEVYRKSKKVKVLNYKELIPAE